ncbi:MAG: diguanylate cyclase domain-containing protein [Cyanophyceae cyanobacterium]
MSELTTNKTPLVLIVDDQKTLRRLLRRSMEKEGYRVAEADNGEACLTLVQEELPDIILLDALMPVMDGFTCCHQLQTRFGDRCPPVLMITALNDRESVDRAFKIGAADFVTKPIHWAVLVQRVRRLLQTNWAMAKLKSLTVQLEAANQQLKQFAFIDGLTQVGNRRYFDDCLLREWKRLAREQSPLSLILWDVDYFKVYNDTYGHPAGDECLKVVASVIDTTMRRPADEAARFGGEEFAAILPNTPVEGARHVAELVQERLRTTALPHAGSPVGEFVTLSAGVAGFVPLPDQSPEILIAAADQALYQAKHKGRNRVFCQLPVSSYQ